ncbi:MAG TPA: nuclear transport factor 2 family protein [Anaerolineae bacterium]|nr:nuclear transport factor 2 family protein [Anaerolineae bacterium]
MKRTLCTVLCFIFVMVSCTGEQSAVQKAPDLEAIRARLEETTYNYAQAWCNKDIDFITGTWAHDDDIITWGVMEKPRSIGWDTPNGVKKNYDEAFSSMKEINFSFSDLMIKVAQDGNSAVITYYVNFEFVLNDGSRGKMTPRVVVVRERRGDDWPIIYSDASYSVDMVKEQGLCD